MNNVSSQQLSQIVEMAIGKLKEARERYLKDEIKEADYIDLTTDITDSTLHDIQSEESKKMRASKIALFFSGLFCFILIGIPFFLKTYKEHKALQAEFHRLKQTLLETSEANSYAILLSKIDRLPLILQDIQKRYTDHRRLELINTQLQTDWSEDETISPDSRSPFDPEFEKDMRTGASFRRIDKTYHIEDQERLPSLKLNPHQRVVKGAALLKELIKNPEDQHWEMLLQLTVSHGSLNTGFKAVLSAFNVDAAKIQWEKNDKYYSIKSIFSETFPPVILEIIRNPNTKTIEKVNVRVKGSLDIVSYNTAQHDDVKVIVPNAITEELHYSITFGKDHIPVISDLHSHMQANVYIPKKSR